MPQSKARRGEGAKAEAPHVDSPATRDPVDQLGDVVGESLDRHGAAGVGCVAVALELDADHPAALGEPGENVAKTAAEGDDTAVQGDERRSCRVAVLLVPDGDAVDLLAAREEPAAPVHWPSFGALKPATAGTPGGIRVGQPISRHRPPRRRTATRRDRRRARLRRRADLRLDRTSPPRLLQARSRDRRARAPRWRSVQPTTPLCPAS